MPRLFSNKYKYKERITTQISMSTTGSVEYLEFVGFIPQNLHLLLLFQAQFWSIRHISNKVDRTFVNTYAKITTQEEQWRIQTLS